MKIISENGDKKMKILKNVLLVIGTLILLTGCGQKKEQTSSQDDSKNRVSQVTTSDPKTNVKITVSINGTNLKAHLNNSSAAKAFAKELPATLSFRDYAGLPEKVADLNHSLSTKGMPSGHAGTKGSIGYWSPEQRIVFYWGTEEYYEGIHIIGKFDSANYRNVIKNMGNNVDIKISKD
ncbi:cyclophilin-like fold protein [Companilactobacillus musae]|uniref:cyclophilin-like fold protein n=2 Tax=Companilactobacillus musae TaxID=1903258 RepID=UPI000E64D4DC|nr:cyclophilin-like fold protein [Companilactobacillus musae]